MPKIAGVVIVILVDDFVAALLAVALPFAAVVDAFRPVLRKILAGSAGATGVSGPIVARTAGGADWVCRPIDIELSRIDLAASDLAAASDGAVAAASRELRSSAVL
jgi:hypothetical protein